VEAAGKPFESVLRIINEVTRKPAASPVEKVLRLGCVVGLANHTVLISRDGTERPIDDSAAPVLDEAGRVIGVVMVFRDISERRRSEVDTRRLAAIVESSNDAIIAKDLNGIITTWNEAAEHLFGYSAGEVIGKPVSILIPADHADDEPGILNRVRSGERVANYETVRLRKNGTRIPVSLTVSPIRNSNGQVIGASKILRDITERKRLEEQLRQRVSELADADRRKDEFLATLAHELRNPLAPISHALAIMNMVGHDGELFERGRQIIERQQQQLVRLVDDLLDMARITRGKIELRRERVALAAIIESAVESSRPFIESFGHKLEVAVPDEPVWLDADPVRLSQVVANLLNNSAKYTPEHGVIRLTGERHDSEAVFRVADNGIGIPPEMLPRIYDAFTQVDTALERAHGGLGIGLTLVKTLVELHGGAVEAHSAGPGSGSEFVVRLPLAAQQHAEPRATDGESAPAIARRVLVVDDNKDVAETLSMLLRLLGHEIQTAYDGPTAINVARESRPHVVLLDVGLPEMNGYEVARRLRAEPELAGTLLVALTGWGQEEDRQRSREAGFDFHLTKPASLDDLEGVLASVESARQR
jgi:PAS domain S-box-containing protein